MMDYSFTNQFVKSLVQIYYASNDRKYLNIIFLK